jgi:crotonobetainyl-CoA:carnitine CoA-transferase CaiB-like acyl-CoA transferase
MWRASCEVLGVPDLVSDPRFTGGAARLAHKEELWEAWEAAFKTQPADVWVTRLTEHGVPASTIKTVPEALSDAESAGRDMVVNLSPGSSASGKSVRVVGNPLRLDGPPGGEHTYPPALGADTDAVLRDEMGLSDDEIAALRAGKVVR